MPPIARPNLDALAPYKAVSAHGAPYNLSANESCLGPSRLAVAAAMEAVKATAEYPDGSATALREAIAARYQIDAERIVCGAGSEELISLIVQAYAGPGDEVLFSEFAFIKYELAARAYGAQPVRAPEKLFHADVDALLDAVTPRTRVLFLANPNNPTGTFLADNEVRRLRAALRDDVLLVRDAAYAEFVEAVD
jgi:histidinol-phosphate aminotransferase